MGGDAVPAMMHEEDILMDIVLDATRSLSHHLLVFYRVESLRRMVQVVADWREETRALLGDDGWEIWYAVILAPTVLHVISMSNKVMSVKFDSI